MAVYCGTDIISVDRIKASIDEFGDTFLKRIYTEEEIAYCESRRMSKYQSYAARFAAKEACYKAFSIEASEGERRGITWHDAEVRRLESGKPQIKLHGKLLEVVNRMGLKEEEIDVSLSHDASFAIATVLGMKLEGRSLKCQKEEIR